MWNQIAQPISEKIGAPFTIAERRSVGGGCINQAYQISDGHHQFFVKINQATQIAMFEAEALGLKDIYESQTIRVPQPIGWGIAEGSAYIVMEWLALGRGRLTRGNAWAKIWRPCTG
jgi:fructosamine-3-kinase